jgi:hypothetical protein
MAKADLSKMKKGDLADFLTKKLPKEDLLTLAEHVQNGTFNAEMLRGVAAPEPTPAPVQPQGDPQPAQEWAGEAPQGEGVTPQDTTANLGEDTSTY